MKGVSEFAVWFPAVRTGTGTDVSTRRLARGLMEHGIRTQITWLPLRTEYAPWTAAGPKPPDWATMAIVNTWMHSRFLPRDMPVIATLRHATHSPQLHSYKGFVRATYHRFWTAPNERRVLRRASKVVAVSRFAADTGRRILLDVPMEVIYNGIDVQRFHPGRRVRGSNDPFRLLYVGGWKKLKGVDLLAPIMRELGSGFELRYTGGLDVRERAAMPSNMHDMGRLDGDKVIAAMQDADAFLFPSRSEGFGLVVAEAMACGLPVIATRGSSLTEIVKDGVTGILCQQDDVGAFVTAARGLRGDAEYHQAMAVAGRDRVKAYFSFEKMVQAYIDLCQALKRNSI